MIKTGFSSVKVDLDKKRLSYDLAYSTFNATHQYSSVTPESKSSLSRKSNSKAKINIHYQSASSPILNLGPCQASMVSSVLLLKTSSVSEVKKPTISNYKGGGFKGTIKKQKVKSLFPTLKGEPLSDVRIKSKSTQKILRKRQMDAFMFSTACFNTFYDKVSGRKLLPTSRLLK